MKIPLIAIAILQVVVNCSESSIPEFQNALTSENIENICLPPIYTEIPEPYNYDNTVVTYFLENFHDRACLSHDLINVYEIFDHKNMIFALQKDFDPVFKSDLVSIFIESYPTLTRVPVSLIDFWYLTFFAMSCSSLHIKIRKIFHSNEHNHTIKRAISCLAQDDNPNQFELPTYMSEKLKN